MRKIVGIHSVSETLKVRPKDVKRLCLKEGWEDSKDLAAIGENAKRLRLRVETVGNGFLEKAGSGHQGVYVETSFTPEVDWGVLREKSQSLVLALDGIEDPQNLGSILRTSWLLGVDAVVAPSSRSAGLTTTVNKVAAGGAEYVPVEFVTALPNFLKDLIDWNYWVFGLSASGESNLWETQIPEKIAWVIGGEADGIKISTQKICQQLVKIPQTDPAASLNAGVAAAMTVFETQRQWKYPR